MKENRNLYIGSIAILLLASACGLHTTKPDASPQFSRDERLGVPGGMIGQKNKN